MRRINALLVLAIAAMMMTGCTCNQQAPVQEEPAKDGIFIHITAGPEDPHRLLMPLRMAVMMGDTHDVAVYLDIKGVLAVVKDAPDVTLETFPTSYELIGQLNEKGIPVMACPGCLKAAGKTPKDLMDGVKVADKNTFFNFTKGRILTIDY